MKRTDERKRKKRRGEKTPLPQKDAAGELVYRTSKKHGAQDAETLTVHMPECYLLLLKE